MANGECCVKCGYQETEHDYPELIEGGDDVCDKFVSEITHENYCSVLGCGGDCHVFVARQEEIDYIWLVRSRVINFLPNLLGHRS